MIQPDLFEKTLDDRFVKWVHSAEGGKMMDMFIKFAWQMWQDGTRHAGAKDIAEQMRWRCKNLNKAPGEMFKCNNSYISRFARFAEERCPEISGLFEKRKLKDQ